MMVTIKFSYLTAVLSILMKLTLKLRNYSSYPIYGKLAQSFQNWAQKLQGLY